jgi:hypothetical protein
MIFGNGGEVLGWRLVEGWVIVDSCGGPSFGCMRWLILFGDIVRVVFELRARWAPNVRVNSEGYLSLNTKVSDEM